jgi:alkanesulfonate monooxygenase SsuD/methylene tetrahydromethanopterin reductase-like flavin-dependent oxidoreductase (luciferase family)
MTVELGLALLAGPYRGKPASFHEDLDSILPKLEGHFRSLWMTDHFFWKDEPTHEAITVMAFLLGRFPKWEVGPMVLGQSYRNPAWTAKMAATLQILSGGRFIMGIGAGWKEDEYRAYNYDFPRAGIRIEQLEDTIEIMKRMWTEPGAITYHGKHYSIVDCWCEPKPDPAPTLVVGGGGEKTMLIAAKHADWWNLSDAPFSRYRERVAILHRHCETIGRDPASLRKSWFGRVAIGRTEAEAQRYALSEAPKRAVERYTTDNAFVGTPAQLVEQMQPFVQETGCDYFMIDILGLPNDDLIGMFIEEVIPKLG